MMTSRWNDLCTPSIPLKESNSNSVISLSFSVSDERINFEGTEKPFKLGRLLDY